MARQEKKPNAFLEAVHRAAPRGDIADVSPNTPGVSGVSGGRTAGPSGEAGLGSRPASRINTRLIAGHFDPKVARQLRIIAAEEDRTIQALLEEALDLLFVKKGKAHIGELTKS